MTDYRFDGRVAIVTGAGRGLGREYALLMAERGAKVVVNDTGASGTGDGFDADPAAGVVGEIHARGGNAVACTHSVATEQGGQAIVQTAIDAFGRIDILVHNAGNARYGSLKVMSQADFDSVLDVHLRGAFHVVRPAFPLMCQQGFGRVVLTSSIAGIYGNAYVANYSVAKAGMIGLSNAIAFEGASEGVKSNVILPGAITRHAEGLDTSTYPDTMNPRMVAPVVGYLAHEDCAVTGRTLISVAGRVASAFVAESRGLARREWDIGDVAKDIGRITDTEQPFVFSTMTGFMDHLDTSFNMAKTPE